MDVCHSIFEDVFSVQETGGNESIAEAANIINHTLDSVRMAVQPDLPTQFVADSIGSMLQDNGVDPGYIISISPEDVAWHGIPGDRLLGRGEIVTIDVACSVRGWWTDISITVPVSDIDEKRLRLIEAAREGTKTLINCTKKNSNGRENAAKMSDHCKRYDVRLISEGAGHGLGRKLHCNPQLTYDGRLHTPLEDGRAYTIEPVFTSGNGRVRMNSDGSAVTEDGEPTAYFEIAVLIRGNNTVILGNPSWLS